MSTSQSLSSEKPSVAAEAGQISVLKRAAIVEDPLVVIVGGLPRSGTTLLSDILNEDDDVAIMAEYGLYDLLEDLDPIFRYGIEHDENAARIDASVERLRPKPARPTVASLQTDLSAALGADQPQAQMEVRPDSSQAAPVPGSNYLPHSNATLQHSARFPEAARRAAIAAAVVRASLGKPKARVIGSKYPMFMLQEKHAALHKEFKSVKYLLTIRNPLTQINSSLNRRNRAWAGVDAWHIQSVGDAIEEIGRLATVMTSFVDRYGEDVFVIKFEDLEAKPAETLGELFSFLGLPGDPKSGLALSSRGVSNILTQQERSELEERLGEVVDGWPSYELTGSGRGRLDSLMPLLEAWPGAGRNDGTSHSRPAVAEGTALWKCLGTGWSQPEAAGVWSESERADLVFGAAEPAACYISLRVGFHLPHGSLGLDVFLNDEPVCRTVLVAGDVALTSSDRQCIALPRPHEQITLWLGPVTPRPDRSNILSFRFSGLRTPKQLKLSEDPRLLGMYLSQLVATTFPG